MSFEQEQSFYIEKASLLKDNVLNSICDPVSKTVVQKSTPQLAISDVFSYGLKNVKIELPRVYIPNEVIAKHEIDRYMKLFRCKEKPATFMKEDMNDCYPNCSEIFVPQNKAELHHDEGLKTSAKILNFSCTKCGNNIRYSPNDLQKHFQLLHRGELPSYPCEMCDFSANDFQSFNQHRRTHRSTLVKCEICNDEHRYTLLDLTKHFTSRHCVNGHFQCAKCRFSTLDVGTFVQHIHRHNEIQYKCDKCQHVSFSKEEFQKHVVSHTGTFPFSCQYCNYMASRKTYLLKHIIALHRDHFYSRDKMDIGNSEKKMETSTGLKLILKRYKTGASRKALWRRKRISSNSCGIEEGAQVFEDANKIDVKCEEISQTAKDKQLNEDHIFLREKHVHSGAKSSTALQNNRAEDGLCSGLGLLKKAVHGPTVLMVKNNKISVPANYSAKFMGFKVVDGKQHIVIKLLPSDKPKLPAGNKIDGVKVSSAESLQYDNLSLLSGAGSHESNQQMSTNNSVYSLTSALSNQYSNQCSGKIKQENDSYFTWNTSRAVVPPVVEVGKCATRFPLKPDAAMLGLSLMSQTGTKDNVSWRNSIPQDHPQVLSSAGTNMLRYDPMKKTFSSEFKILHSEMNRNNKHVFYPTDGSNQTTLPFHNYSKIGILDTSKELLSSKTFPVQSSLLGETTACFPQSATENSSVPSVYGNVNAKNAPVFSTGPSKYAIDGRCSTENHNDGKRYLNARVNQVLEHIAENSKQDNASNCIRSCMPKITSVFSLQSNLASNYLSREINQSLQDVLKVKPTIHPQKYIKTDYDQSCSNSSDYKTFPPFRDQTVLSRLAHSPATFRREPNVNCSATKESVYFRNERHVPVTSLGTQEIQSTPRTAGIGTLRKAQTDTIITQQLAKDKLNYTIQGSNATYPLLSEQKKAVLLQSSPSRYFVPLRLARQQGLQVTGKPSPSKCSSNTQATRPTSLLLNKGPGMILTFGNGSLGTIANATENNSQVLDNFLSKDCAKEAVSTSQLEWKTGSSRTVQNSFGVRAYSGAGSASSVGLPHKEPLNITNSGDCHESGISTVKILTGYQGSKVDSLESRKQQEIGQEQPVYALLPNGRQAVFLKCMSPNKSLVQNHKVFQGTACSQNTEPKNPGAMQQKLFLKIKTFPAAENCQPVSNVMSSLQFNNMHSLNSPALDQKRTAFSSSDALILPGKLIPENACLSNCKSNDPFTSVESVHSSKHVKTRSQKCPSDPAQKMTHKGSSFVSQLSTGTMTNKISKPKQHSKQTNVKVSSVTSPQKNRNLKRKAKDDIWEHPRKKMLHRKCKEKSHMDISELESLIQAPCTQKVSKDTVRILKLLPFNSKQLIKCPRRNQPVVVLNHPDADVPEVVNVMKTIAKFKGHVLKVSLSKRTIDALLEPAYFSNSLYIITDDFSRRKRRILKPVSPVKERFVLKLTLKKTSKNNYQIVKTTSDNTLKTKFSCWFCGRIFDNQDKWVGHGQRHLMEATRDWNSLG